MLASASTSLSKLLLQLRGRLVRLGGLREEKRGLVEGLRRLLLFGIRVNQVLGKMKDRWSSCPKTGS